MAGLAGCNTNPHSPDLSAPPQVVEPAAAGGDHHGPGGRPPKPGIELPNTLTLTYDRTPTFQDVPHHIVLWNANQAVKAELAAAYTQAHSWAQSWIDTKQRPVGRVVVSNVDVDSLNTTQAAISYCQDMTSVIRGDVLTHTGGKPVQPPHTNGQRVQLTMVPNGTKGQWQVTGETVTNDSPQCPPLDVHPKKSKH